MELVNPTLLPGLAFRQFDQKGDLDCVVVLRGTFRHVQDQRAAWVDDQIPLQWQDVYEGNPHQVPMLHQGDLVPEKTGTDVTFLGASHAPDGPRTAWPCGIEIGPICKTLFIFGPQHWEPVIQNSRWPLRSKDTVTDWQLGTTTPTASVPIDWRHARGGKPAFGEAPAAAENPIGLGVIGAREDWRKEAVAAPQIAAHSTLRPDDTPAGLGPIPPFWPQRQRHAGTYDEVWQAERHPLLPLDFDPRFWQCAPEDQIARPFLGGDEPYRLTNLHPDHPEATGRLPGVEFVIRIDDGDWMSLHLDGVQFDWRDEARLLLTWRTRFPLPEAQGVKLHLSWRWLTGTEAAA